MDFMHRPFSVAAAGRTDVSTSCAARLGSFLIAAASALCLAGGAQAADKAADKARAASAPRSPDRVLTQAQLRECVTQKEGLGQRNEAALKAKADIVAAKAELDRTGAEIAASQATLDRTKKEEVDAFNAKIIARNALVEDYQAKAEAFNKDVEDIQSKQEAYSAACGNRRYDDRDLADIQRKK
jgi:hypothetical protein